MPLSCVKIHTKRKFVVSYDLWNRLGKSTHTQTHIHKNTIKFKTCFSQNKKKLILHRNNRCACACRMKFETFSHQPTTKKIYGLSG